MIAHDIEFAPLGPILAETIPALLKAKEQGKVRAVGVSGLPLAVLAPGARRVPPLDFVLSYCHYTLYDTTLEDDLGQVAARTGIGLINAAPLGDGPAHASPARPDWHPAPEALKRACTEAVALCETRGADIAGARPDVRGGGPVRGVHDRRDADRGRGRGQRPRRRRSPVDPGLLAEVQSILAPVSDMTWPSGLPENN